jgi:hypothetical protein
MSMPALILLMGLAVATVATWPSRALDFGSL